MVSARPWIAAPIPPLAWLLFEYGLATALRPACGTVGNWLGPSWGALGLVACAVTAVLVWRLARSRDVPPVTAWLSRVVLGYAGVFALAIMFQTTATLIVPPCVR